MTAILQVFGTFLLWLYHICGNSYALALIVFTLLTKLVLFPLSYKGKKGMMQMNTMQAEMARLQKQYGNNRVKYNEEVQKLYEREGVNPMSGCLWSFLPLPILMGLYYIIRRPMLYMMHLTTDQISAAISAVQKLGYAISSNAAYQEMEVSGLMNGHPDVLAAVQNAVGDAASKLEVINFNFLGLDLSQIPKLKFWENGISWNSVGLFLIPIVVTVLNIAYSKLSQKTNNFNKNQNGSGNASVDRTNKMMLIVMPLMYLWFGYIMPAGMCVYMAFNAIFMAIQEIICARLLRGKYAEMEAARQKRLEEEKEKERQHKAEIAARRAAEAEERKKNKGKKKPANPKKTAPKESRVGMRTYARGRAYDPNRYPVTPYHDPDGKTAQEAVEAEALENEAPVASAEELPVTTVEETAAPVVPAAEPAETAPESPAEETADAPEVPVEEEPASADEIFAEIQKDASEKQED